MYYYYYYYYYYINKLVANKIISKMNIQKQLQWKNVKNRTYNDTKHEENEITEIIH